MLTLSRVPSKTSGIDNKPLTSVVPFGDGYAQESATSPRNLALNFSAQFINLTEAETIALDAFFNAVSETGESFLWKPIADSRYPHSAAARSYVVEDWQVTYNEHDSFNVSGTFTEYFSIGGAATGRANNLEVDCTVWTGSTFTTRTFYTGGTLSLPLYKDGVSQGNVLVYRQSDGPPNSFAVLLAFFSNGVYHQAYVAP